MGIEQLKNARFDGNKLYFDGELTMENSFSKWSIGEFKNVMEIEDGNDVYGESSIIWNFGKDAPDEDEVIIGVWFDTDNKLVDYDGVFELPLPAIVLLEHLGYNCDYVKES